MIAMTTPGVNRGVAQVKLSPKQAETYHAQLRAMIDRIRAKDPTEPIPELWIAALSKDYIEVEIEVEAKPMTVKDTFFARWGTYQNYLNSEEWKTRAAAFKRRQGNKCQLCGVKNAPVHVHHNSYDNVGHEPDIDLIVLCADCHRTHHQRLGLKS